MSARTLGWLGIIRLGLVQTSIGAIVVLTTSTLNRVMVVEWALPAMLPGTLVGLHYAIQITRPRFGYGSDVSGRRTPWIVGGMGVLAAGGILAALATAWMGTSLVGGIALAAFAFALIGLGVGAAGTSLLALLAKRVAEVRRAAAATVVWIMMITGFAVTAGLAGYFLDPFSLERLVAVSSVTALAAFALTLVAIRGVEGREPRAPRAVAPARPVAVHAARSPFIEVLRDVWAEPRARRFTVFVFVSMLAYSAQDLILEPFAGIAFEFTPGQSTQLSGVQHGGVLVGMLLVAGVATGIGGQRLGSLRGWTVGGCVASALALAVLVAAGLHGPPWPLHASVFALGAANGAFAVAAIGSMMALAGQGRAAREGTRMGLWGASQAVAFGLGGFLGTVGVDFTRYLVGTPVLAYVFVFAVQAALFVYAARLMLAVDGAEAPERRAAAAAEAAAPVAATDAATEGSTNRS